MIARDMLLRRAWRHSMLGFRALPQETVSGLVLAAGQGKEPITGGQLRGRGPRVWLESGERLRD